MGSPTVSSWTGRGTIVLQNEPEARIGIYAISTFIQVMIFMNVRDIYCLNMGWTRYQTGRIFGRRESGLYAKPEAEYPEKSNTE